VKKKKEKKNKYLHLRLKGKKGKLKTTDAPRWAHCVEKKNPLLADEKQRTFAAWDRGKGAGYNCTSRGFEQKTGISIRGGLTRNLSHKGEKKDEETNSGPYTTLECVGKEKRTHSRGGIKGKVGGKDGERISPGGVNEKNFRKGNEMVGFLGGADQ